MTVAANIVRTSYVAGQFISIGSAFAGSMFAIYDYGHPDQRVPEKISEYLWIFSFALLAASLGGFTAYKFQGIKIGSDDNETEKPHPHFSAEIAPRNWKSNLAEGVYLIFTNSLALVYNYFLITAIQAMIDNLKDPSHNYPTVPLNIWSGSILFFKTFLVDIPFDMTNADYEACKEIKQDITDSDAAPLASIFVKPFSGSPIYRPTILWLKSFGAASHVATDFLGLLLSVPPPLIIEFHKKAPDIFWISIEIVALISIPLLFVNYIQTLYFEGKISENTLKRSGAEATPYEETSLLTRPRRGPNFLRTLLNWMPILKQPIYYGIYTQSFIRAGGDVMPVVLFLRDMFHRNDWSSSSVKIPMIATLAFFVIVSSFLGTLYSEVKEAAKHYKKDFENIPDYNVSLNLF